MARVKICGFTRERDVDRAVEAGVDAVGAIVDVPVDSPREIDPGRARSIFERVPPFVSTVLVTMPASVERAEERIGQVGPDAVQVHGGLSPEAVAELATRDVTVIAAVDHDEDRIEAYATAADALLVDSTDEAGAGGTGRTHDWDATRALAQLDVPLVLAGGLTPENVAEAVETVEPYAVDAASGVEAEPGRKDPDRVRSFVGAATGVGDR
ncbi:MAG: phosphoribosylanthranilate isomerase [Halodesulfurarchaeum sp.]